MELGNQGEGRENNLNLNLKGWKWIKLGNWGEGMENDFILNLEGGKWKKWEIKARDGK